MKRAPALVPIYRHFYIPSVPNLAGNPVFYVRGCDVRCAGFDLPDFFQREEGQFRLGGGAPPAPAWAAKEARRVEVWTELAAKRDTWRGAEILEGWLGEMGWRLREAGWGEEEVRETLMMGPGGKDDGGRGNRTVVRNRDGLIRHLWLLSLALLQGGWSAEDVADMMGDDDRRKVT